MYCSSMVTCPAPWWLTPGMDTPAHPRPPFKAFCAKPPSYSLTSEPKVDRILPRHPFNL